MPFCSFIVPVYKTENQLARCIRSILNQSLTDFELILVDDGSPDRCPEICDQFAKEESRIQVIHKQNGGVSSARNLGISKAKGEYIWFVDSDDYIVNRSLSQLYDMAKQKEADLYVFNCKGVADDFIGSLEEFMDKYYFTYVSAFSSWNKLYRASLLRDHLLTFDEEETIGEDLLFNLNYYHALMREKRKGHVLFLGQDIYIYDHRSESAMSSKSKNRLDQQLRLFRKARQLLYDDISEDTLTYLFLLHLVSGINQARAGGLRKKDFSLIDFSPYAAEIGRSEAVLNRFYRNENATFAGRMRINLFLSAMKKKQYLTAGRIMGLK